MIEILTPGQQVEIDEGIFARIAHVRICPGNVVVYCCEWWNGRAQECDVFDADRLVPVAPVKQKIGFQSC